MKRGNSHLRTCLTVGLALAAALAIESAIFGGSTNGWETHFERAIIDLHEVISGGLPRDDIPPVDKPVFDSVMSIRGLSDKSPVISLSISGDARAYPLEVMTRHEIVNDVVGDVPVAVTFCPLCNSAIVFDRRVEGRTLRFGITGNLRFSDLVMWDDASESWWQQLTGEAIVGDYAGRQLDFVTSQLISFGLFRDRHPDGKVLRGPLGAYGNNPYRGCDSNPSPFLFAGTLDPRLPTMERVLAGAKLRQPHAFPHFWFAWAAFYPDTLINGG